jgi:tetratricopeptide (TPR) repeat protein
LLVVVAIALSFLYYEAQRGRAASARFDQALRELQGGKYESAEKDLSTLAADEPHRAVGRLANLYLANAYLAQKEPAKAREALLRYLAGDDASVFRDAALDDLAVTYEELGDYKQAEATYRQASAIEGPEQARADLGMARMLQKQGKRNEAVAVYRDFLAQHPYAPERTLVLETLAQLGVSPATAAPSSMVNLSKPPGAP